MRESFPLASPTAAWLGMHGSSLQILALVDFGAVLKLAVGTN